MSTHLFGIETVGFGLVFTLSDGTLSILLKTIKKKICTEITNLSVKNNVNSIENIFEALGNSAMM